MSRITRTPRAWASSAGGATVTAEAVPGGAVFAIAVAGSLPGAAGLLVGLQLAGVGLLASAAVTLAAVVALLVAAGAHLQLRDRGMSPRHTDAARAARGLAPLDADPQHADEADTDDADHDSEAGDWFAGTERACAQDARCADVTPLHARGQFTEGGAA